MFKPNHLKVFLIVLAIHGLCMSQMVENTLGSNDLSVGKSFTARFVLEGQLKSGIIDSAAPPGLGGSIDSFPALRELA